jgi:hypothetical protein
MFAELVQYVNCLDCFFSNVRLLMRRCCTARGEGQGDCPAGLPVHSPWAASRTKPGWEWSLTHRLATGERPTTGKAWDRWDLPHWTDYIHYVLRLPQKIADHPELGLPAHGSAEDQLLPVWGPVDVEVLGTFLQHAGPHLHRVSSIE